MQCPVCHVELRMMDRQGVEIDYCPQCRGVWLDRGELDKLIERSDAAPRHEPDAHHGDRHHDDHRPDHHDDHHSRDQSRGYADQPHKKHKKESFLGDMFDFGD